MSREACDLKGIGTETMTGLFAPLPPLILPVFTAFPGVLFKGPRGTGDADRCHFVQVSNFKNEGQSGVFLLFHDENAFTGNTTCLLAVLNSGPGRPLSLKNLTSSSIINTSHCHCLSVRGSRKQEEARSL